MTAEPVPQTHPLLDHNGPWAEEEYLGLPELYGVRIELVDGDLVMSTSPGNAYQRLVGHLLNAVSSVELRNSGVCDRLMSTGEIHQPWSPPWMMRPARKKPTRSGVFSST